MTFKAVFEENILIGYEYRDSSALFFFGTALGSFLLIEKHYKDLKFYRVRQVHGDKCVEATAEVIEADAHWTHKKNVGLIIATADCIPILISAPQYVCAIHAGWRGIENEIVIKTFDLLKSSSASPTDASTVVTFGPHIQKKSFEVDLSLANSFLEKFKSLGTAIAMPSVTKPSEKSHLDLSKILHGQLNQCGVHQNSIFEFSADTYTDLRFASFRRQKEHASRNLSFVARLIS
jgi:polyphenol oxidase